jgi:hypothetical protein
LSGLEIKKKLKTISIYSEVVTCVAGSLEAG